LIVKIIEEEEEIDKEREGRVSNRIHTSA